MPQSKKIFYIDTKPDRKGWTLKTFAAVAVGLGFGQAAEWWTEPVSHTGVRLTQGSISGKTGFRPVKPDPHVTVIDPHKDVRPGLPLQFYELFDKATALADQAERDRGNRRAEDFEKYKKWKDTAIAEVQKDFDAFLLTRPAPLAQYQFLKKRSEASGLWSLRQPYDTETEKEFLVKFYHIAQSAHQEIQKDINRNDVDIDALIDRYRMLANIAIDCAFNADDITLRTITGIKEIGRGSK